MGPRGVMTIGGLPEGTPIGGCRAGTGGGARVGLSCGLGVGILAEEEDGEQTALLSEGEVTEEVVVPRIEELGGPPGDGAFLLRSDRGEPQDSGVSSCIPPPQSALLSPTEGCPGLHSPPGSAACVSL